MPWSRAMVSPFGESAHWRDWIVFAVVVSGILCLACGEREVDLRTEESTIRTYVNAYNKANNQAMRMCGVASDLRHAFKKKGFDERGRSVDVAVDGIRFEIVKSVPDKTTVTRMFTTRSTTLVVHFTSKFDREFDKTVEVRLQCRRTAYDEEDTWTIL